MTGLPGQQAAGVGLTCASNLTNGAYNGGSCVPLNYFDPQVLLYGHIPEAVYNYIWTDNFDRTKFHEDTAQLVFDGTFFPLPGGDVKAAFGLEHRRDYLKDVPSEAALTSNLYNRAVAGITEGSDIVNEAFGEINLPFFKDRPGLKSARARCLGPLYPLSFLRIGLDLSLVGPMGANCCSPVPRQLRNQLPSSEPLRAVRCGPDRVPAAAGRSLQHLHCDRSTRFEPIQQLPRCIDADPRASGGAELCFNIRPRSDDAGADMAC